MPALFFCTPQQARLINIMPPVKKQESLGTKLQIEQNLDNLQLASPMPLDPKFCQFRKDDGSQCGRHKPQDSDFCWSHEAVEAKKVKKQMEEAEEMNAAIVYKTVLCKHFQKGSCKKGDACTFAHGEAELRKV